MHLLSRHKPSDPVATSELGILAQTVHQDGEFSHILLFKSPYVQFYTLCEALSRTCGAPSHDGTHTGGECRSKLHESCPTQEVLFAPQARPSTPSTFRWKTNGESASPSTPTAVPMFQQGSRAASDLISAFIHWLHILMFSTWAHSAVVGVLSAAIGTNGSQCVLSAVIAFYCSENILHLHRGYLVAWPLPFLQNL